MFSVKGSTSKRSWIVYNSFLTAMNDLIKCEDVISLSYQSADLSQSMAVVVRCALKFETTYYYFYSYYLFF